MKRKVKSIKMKNVYGIGKYVRQCRRCDKYFRTEGKYSMICLSCWGKTLVNKIAKVPRNVIRIIEDNMKKGMKFRL